jgi:hypothetical protein
VCVCVCMYMYMYTSRGHERTKVPLTRAPSAVRIEPSRAPHSTLTPRRAERASVGRNLGRR